MIISTPEQETRDLRPIEVEYLRQAIQPRAQLLNMSANELLFLVELRPPAEPSHSQFLKGLAVGVVLSAIPFAIVTGMALS